jgi:hypothetical protein
MGPCRRTSQIVTWLGSALLLLLVARPSQAQPFNGYMVLDGTINNYIEVPHDPAINPTTAITVEGWVRFDAAVMCTSLIGKNFNTAYWVGTCPDFRSYVQGSSYMDASGFTPGVWTHWAVTYDSTTGTHDQYLNGVLVGTRTLSGPLTTNTDPLRIGSDIGFNPEPVAALDEVRLWNVARTQSEIQSTMNTAISSPMPGLVAVWPLDTDGSDALGNFNGTVVGSPVFTTAVPALPAGAVPALLVLLAAVGAWALMRGRTRPMQPAR